MNKTPLTEPGFKPGTTSMMSVVVPTAPCVPEEDLLFGGIYAIAVFTSDLLTRFHRFANGLHRTKQVSTRLVFGLYFSDHAKLGKPTV